MLVTFLDQVTKHLIETRIPLDGGVAVVDGFLEFVHARNPGAAFGLMARSTWGLRSVFFVVVSLGALAAILWLLITSEEMDWFLFGGYSLFFSGALGNLIDRIRFGEVIDFIHVHAGSFSWPAFNVADSALTLGTVLFFVHLIFTRRGAITGQQES